MRDVRVIVSTGYGDICIVSKELNIFMNFFDTDEY